MNKKTSGDIIKEMRLKLGLSVEQAANLAGKKLSKSAISKLENAPGNLESSKLSSIKALALAYGRPMEHMVRVALGISEDADEPIPTHPAWCVKPLVYAGSLAPSGTREVSHEVVYFPEQVLSMRSLEETDVVATRVDGHCAFTPEVTASRVPAVGLNWVVLIDMTHPPARGALTALFSHKTNLVVFGRHEFEDADNLLMTFDNNKRKRSLGDDVTVLGEVIWRSGS